jgi:small subunit ribosomal protein S17
MRQTPKSIGRNVPLPKEQSDDVHCPFYGSLRVRGVIFTGTVISDRMQKTVTVEWERKSYLRKYQRYETKRSKVKAHVPGSLRVKKGDRVKIAECRPISKTKHFVVIQNLED